MESKLINQTEVHNFDKAKVRDTKARAILSQALKLNLQKEKAQAQAKL